MPDMQTFGYDVETNYKEDENKKVIRDQLRMIQLYNPEKHICNVFYKGPKATHWLHYKVLMQKAKMYRKTDTIEDLAAPRIYKMDAMVQTSTLQAILGNQTHGFVPHNGYYDGYIALRDLGVLPNIVHDSYVAAMSIPSGPSTSKSLDQVTKDHVDPSYDKNAYGKWDDFDWEVEVPTDNQILYGAQDAMASWIDVESIQSDETYSKYMNDVYNIEIALMPVLTKMRHQGIRVMEKPFVQALVDYEKLAREQVDALSRARGTEVKLGSPKNLQVWLFEERGNIPVLRTKTGAPATSEEALLFLSDPIVEDILEAKRCASIASTLRATFDKQPCDRLPDSRIYHPVFKALSESGGGRLYTQDPSVNQWNWTLRRCVVPTKGKLFWAADISAFELMVLAFAAGEKVMIDAYNNGEDLHRVVGSRIYGCLPEEITDEQREATKVVEFATVYGSEGAAVARKLRIPQDDAKDLVLRLMRGLPAISALRDDIVGRAMRSGVVATPLGRYRKIPEVFDSTPSVKESGKRKAFNTFAQSGAADFQKLALARMDAHSEVFGCPLAFTVFDAFLREMDHPDQKQELDQALSDAMTFCVKGSEWKFKFKSGIGSNWAEAKDNMH